MPISETATIERAPRLCTLVDDKGRERDGVDFGADLPIDEVEWAIQLDDSLEAFSGDIENAGALMHALTQGRNAVGKQLVEIEYPEVIIGDIQPELACAAAPRYGLAGHTIVDREGLENHSHAPPGVRCSLSLLPYTPQERFFLLGVEETHHSIYIQLITETAVKIEEYARYSENPSFDEYNATTAEWQALAYKIKLAEEQGMQPAALDFLHRCRERAASIRGKRGQSTTDLPSPIYVDGKLIEQ